MPAHTARYALQYPTGTDLVAQAPAQLKALADSVDDALGMVDDRSTPAGIAPMVRPTLADLKNTTGTPGQIGYVTKDTSPSNNGSYISDGTGWNVLGNRRTILYDNDKNALNTNPTLSEPVENFDEIIINYRTDDNSYHGVSMIHPSGKRIDLIAVRYQPNGNHIYSKAKSVIIDGTKINTEKGSNFITGQTRSIGDKNPPLTTFGDFVTITQVIGIKWGK